MRNYLRRRRPVEPTAVGFRERCGVACGASCHADVVRQRHKAVAVAFTVRAGQP